MKFLIQLDKFEISDESRVLEFEKKFEEERSLREQTETAKNDTELKLAEAQTQHDEDKKRAEQMQELLQSAVLQNKDSELQIRDAKKEVGSISEELRSTKNELQSVKESLVSARAEIDYLKKELQQYKDSQKPETVETEEITLDNLFDMVDEPEDDGDDYLEQFDLTDYQRKFVQNLLPLAEEGLSFSAISKKLNLKVSTVIDRLSMMVNMDIIDYLCFLEKKDYLDIKYSLRGVGLDAKLKDIKDDCFYPHTNDEIKFIIALIEKSGEELAPISFHSFKGWKFVKGLKLKGFSKTIFSRRIKIGMNDNGYYLMDGDDYIKLDARNPRHSTAIGSIHIHSSESLTSPGFKIYHYVDKNDECLLGWIREEKKRIVFTTIDQIEYYYTFGS